MTWHAVQRFLGVASPRPTTIAGWIAVAEDIRDVRKAAA
jgi:hypothetical protein